MQGVEPSGRQETVACPAEGWEWSEEGVGDFLPTSPASLTQVGLELREWRNGEQKYSKSGERQIHMYSYEKKGE